MQASDRAIPDWLSVLQFEATSATAWLSGLNKTSDRYASSEAPEPSTAPFRDDPMRAFSCMCDTRCCKGEEEEILESAVKMAAAPTPSSPPRRGVPVAILSTRNGNDGLKWSGSNRSRGSRDIYQSAATTAFQPLPSSFVAPRTPAPSLLPVSPHTCTNASLVAALERMNRRGTMGLKLVIRYHRILSIRYRRNL